MNSTAKYQIAASNYQKFYPPAKIAHLSEFNAINRLKSRSAPIPMTTAWIRKPAALVTELQNSYHPASFIGTVVPTHDVEIDFPHLSNMLPISAI